MSSRVRDIPWYVWIGLGSAAITFVRAAKDLSNWTITRWNNLNNYQKRWVICVAIIAAVSSQSEIAHLYLSLKVWQILVIPTAIAYLFLEVKLMTRYTPNLRTRLLGSKWKFLLW